MTHFVTSGFFTLSLIVERRSMAHSKERKILRKTLIFDFSFSFCISKCSSFRTFFEPFSLVYTASDFFLNLDF